MKVNDEAADFFNNFDAGSDDGSSSASNSTRGVRPRVEEDVPIEEWRIKYNFVDNLYRQFV